VLKIWMVWEMAKEPRGRHLKPGTPAESRIVVEGYDKLGDMED